MTIYYGPGTVSRSPGYRDAKAQTLPVTISRCERNPMRQCQPSVRSYLMHILSKYQGCSKVEMPKSAWRRKVWGQGCVRSNYPKAMLCVLVRTSEGHCGQRRRPAERPKSMRGHDIRGSPGAFQERRSTGVKEKWRDGTGPRAGWRPSCQGI